MILIFDASAVLAWLRREPGGEIVAAFLADPGNSCNAHAANLCEVYYDFHRRSGEAVARDTIRDLLAAGVILREDFDIAFWQSAGNLKATLRRISLADCCGVALALRLGGEFVTGDHHEFDAIAPLGLCPIRFFR